MISHVKLYYGIDPSAYRHVPHLIEHTNNFESRGCGLRTFRLSYTRIRFTPQRTGKLRGEVNFTSMALITTQEPGSNFSDVTVLYVLILSPEIFCLLGVTHHQHKHCSWAL
jgi:hypothetical protein